MDNATESAPDPAAERPRLPWWGRDRVLVAVLVVIAAGMWFMRRRGPAMAMEEAMMLQVPMRVAHGAVQGRDVDYFYGPLSLWIPAAIYKASAATLLVERAIGAAYLAVLGVALHVIGRRWSPLVGLAMGAIAIFIGALSITALPIFGAIGFLVAGLAFASSDLSEHRRAWATGFALAVSAGLRPDFAVWGLVLLTVLTVLGWARLRTWIACALGGVFYLVIVVQAGWSAIWRNLVTDGLRVSGERHLPFGLHLSQRGIMVLIAWVVIVAALVLGWRRRRDDRGKLLVGLGVIGACLVPEYLQRADGTHAVYVTMVPLATLVPVLWELVEILAPRRLGSLARHGLVAVLAGLVLFGVQPKFLARSTVRDARFIRTGGIEHAARINGGEWYYQSAASARAHQRLAATATRYGRPGEVLFVGPVALSRPSYSDGSFYTLLPQFIQTTRFYDFHPRVALVSGDRLARDVRDADLVILCDVGFDEDNSSARTGSGEADRVVATRFSPVAREGNCRLYLARGSAALAAYDEHAGRVR